MKERIKLLRNELKLSQAKFGEKIGVKTSTVGNWEAGLQPVPNARVFQICQIFNVSQNWLLNGSGSMFTQQKNNAENNEIDKRPLYEIALANGYDDNDARILDMLSKLTKNQLTTLSNFINAMTPASSCEAVKRD